MSKITLCNHSALVWCAPCGRKYFHGSSWKMKRFERMQQVPTAGDCTERNTCIETVNRTGKLIRAKSVARVLYVCVIREWVMVAYTFSFDNANNIPEETFISMALIYGLRWTPGISRVWHQLDLWNNLSYILLVIKIEGQYFVTDFYLSYDVSFHSFNDINIEFYSVCIVGISFILVVGKSYRLNIIS